MVEARGRKAAFLREAVRTLGLHDVDVEQTRFQALPASLFSEFDIVIVRALKADDDLLATVLDLLKPSGQFITFGIGPELPGFAAEEERQLPDGSWVVSWSPSRPVRTPRCELKSCRMFHVEHFCSEMHN